MRKSRTFTTSHDWFSEKYTASLSVSTAIFPREPGLGGFSAAKDDGRCGDNWSYETCKAPVKSSPPRGHSVVTSRYIGSIFLTPPSPPVTLSQPPIHNYVTSNQPTPQKSLLETHRCYQDCQTMKIKTNVELSTETKTCPVIHMQLCSLILCCSPTYNCQRSLLSHGFIRIQNIK